MTQRPVSATPACLVLGGELRRLRRARGLSQRQVAAALNFSAHSAIADYESSRRIPAREVLLAYERFLNLPEASLQHLRNQALQEQAGTEGSGPAAKPADSNEPDESEPVQSTEENEPIRPIDSARGLVRRWATGGRRPVAAAVLAAITLVGAVFAARSAAGSGQHLRADGWSASTQNVTAQGGSERLPEDMDGDDPRARGCDLDAVTLGQIPLYLPGKPLARTPFGTLRLRHSARCTTDWASAYYANPELYTIELSVHRPADGAEVRSSWGNNTPPGSYSDMLSTSSGCVWVSAVVVTPAGSSRPVRTGCLR